ncbi:Predicted acetyltransferase [uncultured Ruminococcus sp.]|mgnify:CR=1 FL=1|uniref:GNAT family N-acetyltransferase n=1 Tax=Hydrogeniiclostridium mannosilyticum TaxID=2764322 RepID=UPI000822DAF1|nr:GNAT family N-acetyltransferase [Hydrogeniiclostridium mannosilyticum]SCH39338.1 Predicted acetyltransferase [uncultured Ruminococcus sp.]
MTNKELLAVAMQQSALDLNCAPEDFLREESVVVHSCAHPQARRYLELPFYCNLVSYGNHIVASVNPEIEPAVRDYIRRFAAEHCFETPNLHVLNDALQRHGHRLCFMAEYFLPDLTALEERPCAYEVELWGPERFGGLYLPQWSNALCEKRRELDVLAAAALDRGRLVGLAGCSADCGAMWQIGIDVLPEYRRQGIASALTSRLALEILRRGKVPFYCAAWSNLRSVRNAVRSGFRPAWVELTAKSAAFVAQMNGEK